MQNCLPLQGKKGIVCRQSPELSEKIVIDRENELTEQRVAKIEYKNTERLYDNRGSFHEAEL